MVAFIQFIVRKMRITLSDLDAGVPGQFLGKLKIARGAQDGRNKIVPEGVGGDAAFSLIAQRLTDALADNIPSGSGCDWLDHFSGSLIMPGKKGQGGKWVPGGSIQRGAEGKIAF